MSSLRFVISDLVADEAAAAFAEHERRIRARLASVEVRHRGSTSVGGVLTAGDVDLHVRVDRRSFEGARDVLSELYEPFHLDMWHSEAAFFSASGSRPAVEIALTAIGSSDDRHHGEAWDRIAAEDELVARYNALKREHEGGSEDRYRAAKRDFFHAILH